MHDATNFSSPLARWARYIAVFSAQLAVVAILLHRFLSLPTPVALSIFAAALAGATVAVLLAVGSFVAIWRDGRIGAWSASIGLFLGIAILAWPAGLVPLYRSLPAIHDITTDTTAPPSFAALASVRSGLANAAVYEGPRIARRQLEAYPDIRPVIVPRPVGETWDVLSETIKRLHWRVASETPPSARRPGYVEAVDRTLVLGFYDDIVVRVTAHGNETRVDARSASRYGEHDFGRNAQRIRALFKELKLRLDETVTGSDLPRRRRGLPEKAVPRRGKGDPVALRDQKQKQGRAQPDSRREQQQTAKQPARAADRDRDRQPRRPPQ
jgi:uncharacterized protein (DUF1499 family)